jgi:replication factor A1
MVRYHYALVDDLISREEFDRRIEQKITACGNLADETAAALLVVRDLDRSHVKIRGLRGRSSLFCFYAKVVALSEVKEFDRHDGNKGLVARLTVADETGQTDLVFWDEQAASISESFEVGEVIEVIGRHGKSLKEILPLNLRKTHVEIDCPLAPKEVRQPERRDLDLLLVSLQPVRSFTRRDGTAGEMITGIVGDSTGTAKLLCWEAAALEGFSAGIAVTATGVLEKEGDFGGREIVFDENTVLSPAVVIPQIPKTPLSGVQPDQTVTVSGQLVLINPPRPFTRRNGSLSLVRNVRISDGTGELPLVIWDDEASRPLITGDLVILYHVQTRIGRTGEVELSLGRGSSLFIVPGTEQEPITMQGTILVTADGKFIDDGVQAYMIECDEPHGTELDLSGIRSGNRVFPEVLEQTRFDPDDLKRELDEFLQTLS